MLQQHAHCAGATAIIQLIIFVAYSACWVCLCCHNPLNSDMDYRTFIVRTDVNACNCMQGVYGHWKRVCTESWLWEENSLPHQGIEPASVAWWSGALNNLATSHDLAMSGCQLAVLVSVSMILCSVSVRWLCLCQSHFFLFVSAWSPSVWISLCSPCVCQHGLVQCFSLMTMSVCQSHFFFSLCISLISLCLDITLLYLCLSAWSCTVRVSV